MPLSGKFHLFLCNFDNLFINLNDEGGALSDKFKKSESVL